MTLIGILFCEFLASEQTSCLQVIPESSYDQDLVGGKGKGAIVQYLMLILIVL
jgi:hypothetical protein